VHHCLWFPFWFPGFHCGGLFFLIIVIVVVHHLVRSPHAGRGYPPYPQGPPPGGRTAGVGRFCAQCGAPLRDDQAFCGACGARRG